MHKNAFTHNDVHLDNVAVGYENKSKIYLFGNLDSRIYHSEIIHIEFSQISMTFLQKIYSLDFSHAVKNKTKITFDLWSLSHILYAMTSPSTYECKNKWLRNHVSELDHFCFLF